MGRGEENREREGRGGLEMREEWEIEEKRKEDRRERKRRKSIV